MHRLIAEFIGTFCLVLAGTGAIVINDATDGTITHVGVALVFGLVVLAMIYAVGDISGAHLNPAVTIGFCVAKRFSVRSAVPYLLAQCAGAFAASGTLLYLFGNRAHLGATLPNAQVWSADFAAQGAFILELLLTAILMFVILQVSTGAKEKGIMAGVAVGAVIGLEALFAGPMSGASMNPARSLAPAVMSAHLVDLWVYLTAPVVGAVVGVGAFGLTQKRIVDKGNEH